MCYLEFSHNNLVYIIAIGKVWLCDCGLPVWSFKPRAQRGYTFLNWLVLTCQGFGIYGDVAKNIIRESRGLVSLTET